VVGLAVAPDGRLASLGADGLIRLWTLHPDGVSRLRFGGELACAGARLVGFTGEGDLVVAGDHGLLTRWVHALGNARRDGPVCHGVPEAVGGSRPSLVTRVDGTPQRLLWDLRGEGAMVPLPEVLGALPGGVQMSTTGDTIACVMPDASIRIHRLVRRPGRPGCVIRRGACAPLPVALDARGDQVAGQGAPDAVHVWHTHNAHCNTVIAGLEAAPSALAFSPTGTHLAFALVGGGWRLHRVRDGRNVDGGSAAEGELRVLAFTPAGSHLVMGGADGTVRARALSPAAREP
jgi:WD40 repeat protein